MSLLCDCLQEKGKKKKKDTPLLQAFQAKPTQCTSQAKVDDLDPCASGVYTHNVFWLEVQVDDVLLVNVLHALQDLLHVAGTGGLCVLKVVIHDAFKELAASDAEHTDKSILQKTTFH